MTIRNAGLAASDGEILNISVVDTSAALPDIPGLFVPPEGVEPIIGHYWTGSTVVPPTPTMDDLRVYAASRRFEVETGGITVGGATVSTDRDSQALITGAYTYVQASGAEVVPFKARSGWVDLSADQIRAIALAVGAHVQAAFAAERDVDAAITAGSVTVFAQIDDLFREAATISA